MTATIAVIVGGTVAPMPAAASTNMSENRTTIAPTGIPGLGPQRRGSVASYKAIESVLILTL